MSDSCRFVFTLFDEDLPYPFGNFGHDEDYQGMTYFCYQREQCPTTDKLHWQGYVEFKKRKRLSSAIIHFRKVCLWSKFHVEIAHGNPKQNRDYCSKSESAVPDTFFEWGEISQVKHGQRSDLERFRDMIDEGMSFYDIVAQDAKFLRYHNLYKAYVAAIPAKTRGELEVIYIWGPPGTGKSHKVHSDYPEAFCPNFGQEGSIWWDGYSGHKTVILDDINLAKFPREYILKVLDRYKLMLPVKGSTVPAQYDKIIMTSNVNPQHLDKAITDRFTQEICLLGKSRRAAAREASFNNPDLV